jgi:hypothetical protein
MIEIDPYPWLNKAMKSLKKCASGYRKHDISLRLKMFNHLTVPTEFYSTATFRKSSKTVIIKIIARDDEIFLGGETDWHVSLLMQAEFLIKKHAAKQGFTITPFEDVFLDSEGTKHKVELESSITGFGKVGHIN